MSQGASSSSGGAGVGRRVLGRRCSRHENGGGDPAAAAADRSVPRGAVFMEATRGGRAVFPGRFGTADSLPPLEEGFIRVDVLELEKKLPRGDGFPVDVAWRSGEELRAEGAPQQDQMQVVWINVDNFWPFGVCACKDPLTGPAGGFIDGSVELGCPAGQGLWVDVSQNFFRTDDAKKTVQSKTMAETRYGYSKTMEQIRAWCLNNDVPAIKDIAVTAPHNSFLNYHLLTKDVLEAFFGSLRKEKNLTAREKAMLEACDAAGKKRPDMYFAASHVRRYTTALKYFQPEGFTWPESCEAFFKSFAKGYEKQAAARKQKGIQAEFAKDHIPMAVFLTMCVAAMAASGYAAIPTYAFMVLCCNLFCRGVNVACITFDAVTVDGDTLLIDFRKTKCNEAGLKNEKRHIVANPFNPTRCPVLALGLQLATYAPTARDDNPTLWDNAKYHKTFGKDLKKVRDEDSVQLAAQKTGTADNDVSVHSMRKTGACDATSGSATTNVVAVCLRGCWKMGVLSRYFKWEETGDIWCARRASGLSADSEQFMVLGPCFKDVSSEVEATINEAINEVFACALARCTTPGPNAVSVDMRRFRAVLRRCLATLLHSRDWLVAEDFKRCPALRTHELMKPKYAVLKEHVFVGYKDDSDVPLELAQGPRGIPEGLAQSVKMGAKLTQALSDGLEELDGKIDVLGARVRENGEAIAACTSSIEALRTHVAQGALDEETRHLLQEVREGVAQIHEGQTKIIETVKDQAKKGSLSLKQHFTKQLRRRLRPNGGSEGATSLAAQASERGQETPEDMLRTFKTTTAATFKFPCNKVTPALTLWWLGAPAQGIPPLQLVPNHCFKNKMTANTHSKLKTCAWAVMDVLQMAPEPATNMEVADALLRALPVLNKDTPQRRRNKHVAVSTLAGKIGKLVRENKKQGDADEVARKRARHGRSADSDDEAEAEDEDDEDDDSDQANE